MKKLVKGFAVIALLAMPLAASAQYSQNFDGLNGSASGVLLTGQDGYYLPNGTGDTDFMVYTYAGNVLGFPTNPNGGTKFIAGTGPGNAVYARAQRDVILGAGMGLWKIEYEWAGRYDGAPPGSQNVGSFSTRQGTNTSHINLLTWVDPNNPVAIQSNYVYYDANNVQIPTPGTIPGPEWNNLQVNHWYYQRMVIDLDQNLITEVAIRDLSGGTEAVYHPTGWYLYGGASPTGVPDAIRFFGGGGNPGNTTAWDNCVVAEALPPQGACCLANGSCFILTPDDCLAHDGVYQGDGTVCDPNPCTPVPVQKTTWGDIKHQFK